jgi:hypothetical protein
MVETVFEESYVSHVGKHYVSKLYFFVEVANYLFIWSFYFS